MDVKVGASVGFTTALGITGGALFGFLAAELVNLKKPGSVIALSSIAGALIGAFVGGTLAAPDPNTASAQVGAGAVWSPIQNESPIALLGP
jgi:hypothetical protein